MNRSKRAICLTLLGLAVVATAISQSGDLPVNWKELPAPFATESARNQPEVISKPEDAQLKLPAGFAIEEYMSGFERPRFMLQGAGSEILMSDSGAGREATGGVYVLNGKTKTRIIDKLDRPYGLALRQGTLYVAEPTSVKTYQYDPKAMKVTGEGTEIISLKGFGQGHWTRSLLFNKDQSKLYVTVGSGSNIDLGEDPMRAALHRYNPDGSGHETIATGLRNIIGLKWRPGSEDLWAAIQERDGLGDDLVSDYVVKIKPGGFYGWPIAYTGPHKEPRHENVDMAKVKSALYPDVLLGAHVAVLDIAFYTGKMFPEKYRDGMFLAFHGSWNRSKRTGYSVNFIPFKDGTPTSGPQDFLSGWMLSPEKREVWGRPVGLFQMPDGSLLVTDDGSGKIWRISYKS